MKTQADLDRYVQSVKGEYIDVDNVFGAQCWDQWSHYATQFLGVPSWQTYTNAGGLQPHNGWACNVYHNARAAGLEQWFEILPATATPRPGDAAFWEFGTVWYPGSHVATVLQVMPNGLLRCLTQNPGRVQIADLINRGLLGYLRPRNFQAGRPTVEKTPTNREDETMSKNSGFYYTRAKDGAIVYLIANYGAGIYHEYTDGRRGKSMPGEYNNRIAATMGTNSFAQITEKHARVIKQACDKARGVNITGSLEATIDQA